MFKKDVNETKHIFALRAGIVTLFTLMFYFVPVLTTPTAPVATTANAFSENVVTVIVVDTTP